MVTNLRIDDWQTLHQRLRGIAKRRAILDAEEAQCLREAEQLKLWRRLGYIHMSEYLERELAVLAGCGIGFAFEVQVAAHLAGGALEAVLHAWCPSFPGFHVYYPSRRVSPALRAFVDALKRQPTRKT